MPGSNPPPLPPFLLARDVDTEPGVGRTRETWKEEAQRLRKERDAAIRELEARDRASMPPTRKQKTLGAIAQGSKYAGLFTLAALALRAVSKAWPQYADVIDGVLGAFGL